MQSKPSLSKRIRRQRGLSMIEYSVALCVLLPAFVVAGYILQKAIKARTLASRTTVQHMTPSNPVLSDLRNAAQEESSLDNTAADEHD